MGEGEIPTIGLRMAQHNTQHWTDEIDNNLLVTYSHNLGRRTPHAMQGHTGGLQRGAE